MEREHGEVKMKRSTETMTATLTMLTDISHGGRRTPEVPKLFHPGIKTSSTSGKAARKPVGAKIERRDEK